MQLGGNMINQPRARVLSAALSSEPARRSVSDTGTDPAGKADSTMYENHEDRIEAAEQLARLDPRAGAEVFWTIAYDGSADDEHRIHAAGRASQA